MTTETPTRTGVPEGIDPLIPNPARIYDYFLGGTLHFAADREEGRRLEALLPCQIPLARAARGFLRRSVDFMVSEGIDQFLDIGSGLPTVRNSHEVAQARNPQARVAYVDRDRTAVAHGELILADTPGTVMVAGDLRDPGSILNHPRVRELLDFDRPLGLLLANVMSFISDDEDPDGLVAAYRDACAPGSFITISGYTDERADDQTREQAHAMVDYFTSLAKPVYARDHAAYVRWFEGTELVSPGVTAPAKWRPDAEAAVLAQSESWMLGYAGVGRVP